MAKSDFTKYTKTFVDETVPSGGRKYSISGTGTGQTITDTTATAGNLRINFYITT